MPSQGPFREDIWKQRWRKSWRCTLVRFMLQWMRGGRKQRAGLLLLPMATVVAHNQVQSGRQLGPIVRDDTLRTLWGHTERYSHPAAAELGLSTTVCTVTT